jgi:uncharacterized membrane protein
VFLTRGVNLVVVFLLLAFVLGLVSGLRTFTAPAVLWIMRHGGFLSYVLAAAALFEYFYDVQPNTPPRTAPFGLICRALSGAFVGFWACVAGGIPPAPGALAGAAGAILGAFGSLAIRRQAIAVIGNLPSGLLEDIVAIAASIVIISRL